MDIESLTKRMDLLEKQVRLLKDENDIFKLENAYGYFLEHLMVDEIADCWADKGALEWLGLGVFRGKERIRETWKTVKQHFAERGETRHMGPRFTPYITVAPDGPTAKARWYVAGGTFGAQMLSEDTYVKEDGVWKIDLMSVRQFPDGLLRGRTGRNERHGARRGRGAPTGWPSSWPRRFWRRWRGPCPPNAKKKCPSSI